MFLQRGFTLALMAVLVAACADDRPPYEAYVACNEGFLQASSERDVGACFAREARSHMQQAQARDAEWLQSFKAARPVALALHEEQPLPSADESILKIVGQSRFGELLAISVLMRREGRRWRIAMEEQRSRGASIDDSRPAAVELKVQGDVEWTGGDLFGYIGRTASTCTVVIQHVFDHPQIRMGLPCALFEAGGRYPVDAVANTEASFTFYDHRHVNYADPSSGFVDLQPLDSQFVAGTYSVEVSNGTGTRTVTVSGRFENLRFPERKSQ